MWSTHYLWALKIVSPFPFEASKCHSSNQPVILAIYVTSHIPIDGTEYVTLC